MDLNLGVHRLGVVWFAELAKELSARGVVVKVKQDDSRVLLDLGDIVCAEEIEEEVTVGEIAGNGGYRTEIPVRVGSKLRRQHLDAYRRHHHPRKQY